MRVRKPLTPAQRAHAVQLQRERRGTRDTSVPEGGKAKTERIALGLYLLALAREPGEVFSCDEIAAWCGCTGTAIWNMEQIILRKLQRLAARNPELRDAMRELFARHDRRAEAHQFSAPQSLCP